MGCIFPQKYEDGSFSALGSHVLLSVNFVSDQQKLTIFIKKIDPGSHNFKLNNNRKTSIG